MMEKIELRVNENPPLGYHHLFVVYTNSAGQEFVIRGGPEDAFIPEGVPIDAEINAYGHSSLDWVPPGERLSSQSRIIASGVDLQEKYLEMAFAAQLLESSHLTYTNAAILWSEDGVVNSNTLATFALSSGGYTITPSALPSYTSEEYVPGFNNFGSPYLVIAQYLNDKYSASALSLSSLYRSMLSQYIDRYKDNLWDMWNPTGVTIDVPQCFPSCTQISMFEGNKADISNITVGSLVVSFDASGALVPGRVTQLLHSITDTWLHLSNGTYVTPGQTG